LLTESPICECELNLALESKLILVNLAL